MTTPGEVPEPPMVLDGARVLAYAPFDAQIKSGARASAVLGGVALDLLDVAGLAIVEDLARSERFVLICNHDWATLAVEPCADVAAATARGEAVFPGSARLWRPFRELTPAEGRELETTRDFLRELMASDPDA